MCELPQQPLLPLRITLMPLSRSISNYFLKFPGTMPTDSHSDVPAFCGCMLLTRHISITNRQILDRSLKGQIIISLGSYIFTTRMC